jgi:hypothetical protein
MVRGGRRARPPRAGSRRAMVATAVAERGPGGRRSRCVVRLAAWARARGPRPRGGGDVRRRLARLDSRAPGRPAAPQGYWTNNIDRIAAEGIRFTGARRCDVIYGAFAAFTTRACAAAAGWPLRAADTPLPHAHTSAHTHFCLPSTMRRLLRRAVVHRRAQHLHHRPVPHTHRPVQGKRALARRAAAGERGGERPRAGARGEVRTGAGHSDGSRLPNRGWSGPCLHTHEHTRAHTHTHKHARTHTLASPRRPAPQVGMPGAKMGLQPEDPTIATALKNLGVRRAAGPLFAEQRGGARGEGPRCWGGAGAVERGGGGGSADLVALDGGGQGEARRRTRRGRGGRGRGAGGARG